MLALMVWRKKTWWYLTCDECWAVWDAIDSCLSHYSHLGHWSFPSFYSVFCPSLAVVKKIELKSHVINTSAREERDLSRFKPSIICILLSLFWRNSSFVIALMLSKFKLGAFSDAEGGDSFSTRVSLLIKLS